MVGHAYRLSSLWQPALNRFRELYSPTLGQVHELRCLNSFWKKTTVCFVVPTHFNLLCLAVPTRALFRLMVFPFGFPRWGSTKTSVRSASLLSPSGLMV